MERGRKKMMQWIVAEEEGATPTAATPHSLPEGGCL